MSDGSMTNTGPSCPEWRLRAIEPPLGRLASTPAFGLYRWKTRRWNAVVHPGIFQCWVMFGSL